MFSYYGIFTWLPKLLVEQGHTVVKTFEYMLVMILAQLPGYFSAAVLVERVRNQSCAFAFKALEALLFQYFQTGLDRDLLYQLHHR